MPRPPRRHLTPLNLALGAVAVGGVVVAVVTVGPETTASTARERVVTVSKGVVQSTVSGSGNLSPANTMNMSFGAAGRVTKVYVKAGDHVEAGQLLARIDPSSAEVDLAETQATLQSAQDALDAIESGTTSTTTASTQTATTATAAVAHAAAATTAAPPSTAAPASTTAPATTSTAAPASTATPQKTAAPSGTTSSGRSGAGASGGGSGASSSSSGGGSQQSEASAAAAVKSAQLAVDNAEQALAATALRAPAAATVAEVDGAVGDQVSAGSAASSSSSSAQGGGGQGGGGASSSSSTSSAFVVLTQLSRMHLAVSLSESDIGSVKVGQQATVTINAASGEEVAGKVIDIGVLSSSSTSSSSSASAVSYPVTIALTQTAKGLRAGMSATAEIVTAQASGVVVPSQALRGSSVTVVAGGKRTTRRVETGVAGDSSTQVVSGLDAGDQVVVTSASATAGVAAGAAGASGAQSQLGAGTGTGARRFGGGTGGAGFGGGGAGFFPGGGGTR